MEVTPSNWVEEALTLAGMSKKALARAALGHENAAYLNRLRRGMVTPTARTVRRIAEAGGIADHLVPLLMARAGHPEGSLIYLAALAHVGRIVCAQAGVELDPVNGVVQGWVGGVEFRRDNQIQPPRRNVVPARTFQQTPLADPSNPQRIADFIVLPKTTALAIDLAVLGFPRRGDVVPSGFLPAFADLMKTYGKHWSLEWAKKVIADAGDRLRLPKLLAHASAIYRARGVDPETRQAIACETIQGWANSLCLKYAENKRYRSYVATGITGLTSPQSSESIQRLHRSLFPDQERIS